MNDKFDYGVVTPVLVCIIVVLLMTIVTVGLYKNSINEQVIVPEPNNNSNQNVHVNASEHALWVIHHFGKISPSFARFLFYYYHSRHII